jgi:ring-1,2-phenylacetyl-CoA epoxidase subunit PaaE
MEIKLEINGDLIIKEISSDKTILEQLLEYDIPYSCLSGHCSACMCKLICGEVTMLNSLALTDKEIEKGYILTCQSYAKTDIKLDFNY